MCGNMWTVTDYKINKAAKVFLSVDKVGQAGNIKKLRGGGREGGLGQAVDQGDSDRTMTRSIDMGRNLNFS